MPRIRIFTTKNSLKWVKNVELLSIEPCNFEFTVYDSLAHLQEIFLEKIQQVDGILFSGQIPYFFIQQHFPNVPIPMLHFDVTQADFYRALSEYIYKHKDFQMKRCLVDFLYEENNYLGVYEWAEKDDTPYLFDLSMQAYADMDVYNKLRDFHIEMWKQNKVDVSMTRLGNLPEMLEPHGIKPILVVPSEQSMIKIIEALLKEIQLLQLIENQVVIGHLEMAINRDNMADLEYRQMSLHKAILDFSKNNHMSFIIHRNVFYYEIITNYSDFKLITNEMQNCQLASFLTQELKFPVHIGWGIGNSIQEAQLNAEKASQICATSETQSYILSKEETLIGPLGDKDWIRIDTQYDLGIEKLSLKLNTSPLQIQKVMAVMDKLQSNMIASEDLSSHLGITTRAANRILKKLEEHGAATVSTQLQKKLRGRPKKVYEIHFDRLERQTDQQMH
ncbi:hypothetical protein [Psychrobacillus lasiicapitis]|uniref:HTH domain-containing protein n=1 Tax=Psychrobacillus lasiicapitis TaxID=1636719 RepID=A0A544T720_9BACI|nr:hypothetical protein [Psychrobacillus lasiicapitis]TQR13239.1 hypothetical protein FG382_12050 [Psychrobacillus lasiicapitis]GGA33307.1 hypothetical protein GCM10011384_23660 [Psychrobacillus lasiicapitis]